MNKIYLKNFRLFKDWAELDLAPITILTGKNSSGKSSIIKSILLLSDYLENDSNQLTLNFGGQSAIKHRINIMENALTWNSGSNSLQFCFEQDHFLFSFKFSGQKEDNYALLDELIIKSIDINQELKFNRLSANEFELVVSQDFIDYLAEPNRVSTREIRIGDSEKKDLEIKLAELRLQKEKTTDQSLVRIISEEQIIENRLKLLNERVTMRGTKMKQLGVIFQTNIILEDEDASSFTINNLIRRGLSKYMEENKKEFKFSSSSGISMVMFRFSEGLTRRMLYSAYHLSPNRTHQARLYYLYNYNNEINDILNQYGQLKPAKGGKAHLFLKKWIKIFCDADDIEVKTIDAEASTIKIIKNNSRIDLADLGFGTGQLLTILLKITIIIHQKTNKRISTRSFFRNRNTIVMIEEPESNLHPQLQSVLSEMFIEASKEYFIQFILETHSEYLIRKLQVMTAQKKIDPTQVNIYYIDISDTKDNILNKISILPSGELSDTFGEGFFDEADKHAMDLFRIQKRTEKSN
jgi:predicted ATPase